MSTSKSDRYGVSLQIQKKLIPEKVMVSLLKKTQKTHLYKQYEKAKTKNQLSYYDISLMINTQFPNSLCSFNP